MAIKQQTPSIEETATFTPQFDEKGLIPCITVSKRSGKVLMMAYMNAEALQKTTETGEAHYWSRSRNKLWKKGETSGQIQKVTEIRTDCDQDTLLITVETPAPETACHTGRQSCFYRTLKDGKLVFED